MGKGCIFLCIAEEATCVHVLFFFLGEECTKLFFEVAYACLEHVPPGFWATRVPVFQCCVERESPALNLLMRACLKHAAVMQAMEPFFSVLLSAIFLGDTPTIPILLTLLPIVGGVALASATEATFNWGGFLAAMGSNVTFQSRNVFSKKFMGKGKVRFDVALRSFVRRFSSRLDA